MSPFSQKLLHLARRFYKDILILVLLVLGLEWWQSRNLSSGGLPEKLKLHALPLLDGSESMLWQSGKPTLLYVFAPWCGVCNVSASNLNTFLDSDINVISLALSWESKDEVQEFVSTAGLKTPVALGDDNTSVALQIDVFPSYFVIGSDGKILKAWSGYTTTAGLWLRAKAASW
jgi:peroxiredoxin